MKSTRFLLVVCLLVMMTSGAWALKGMLATQEQITQLKKDLLEGKVEVGIARLKDIRQEYGEAITITDSDRKVIYDYGDLKIDFTKTKLWRDWEYDTFKSRAYTDDIDDLRFDLESEELVGTNVTIKKVKKDYGEPTESIVTNEDGAYSIYYYGNIKLTFENVILLRSWKGDNLDEIQTDDLLKKE